MSTTLSTAHFFRCTAIILITAVLLTACGTLPSQNHSFARGDSAPQHTINIDNITDAKPRIEARSRYGNPDSYVIRGVRYHVRSSSTSFQQQGIASWYGTKFHGRKTSSGEAYDMYAMTAAHKTLPLPTWVEVINHDNQHRIIVKVNDRGPFISGRIIDLSYAAAAKLGVIATGTANVTIRAIDPAKYIAASNNGKITYRTATTHPVQKQDNHKMVSTLNTLPVSLANSNERQSTWSTTETHTHAGALASTHKTLQPQHFYLQVAAFNDRNKAEQLRQRLLFLQPDKIQIETGTKANQIFYRVKIGPISSLSAAGRLAAEITAMGLEEPQIMLD